jgi:hypothetical protein
MLLVMRVAEGGYFACHSSARVGRGDNSPPQLGHALKSQSVQNVHSSEQITAPSFSAGKSLSQFSQFGRISSKSVTNRAIID